jgi:uncharacterized protein YjdB
MKPQHFIYYLAIITVLFTACKKNINENHIPITGITLNQNELALVPCDTATLITIVQPDNASNKNVKWSSGNPEVATVSDNGLVTAIAEGETTITVTTDDGNKTAICKVTVMKVVIPVTGIILNKNELTFISGDTVTLLATVLPNNASNKNVTWLSDNSEVATVSDNGLVTANADGKVTISVTTQDGNKTASCSVSVDYRNK